MGLSYSKSLSFGGLRFNFSGSGIGVSAGIPGLRIGVGPRGAYVSGGAYGFRYRQSIPLTSKPKQASGGEWAPAPGSVPPRNSDDGNIAGSVKHDDISVMQLTDSSDDALLTTLNEQRKKLPFWPFAAAGLGLFIYQFSSSNVLPGWAVWGIASLLAGLSVWLYWRDQVRRVTVLFFDLDDQAQRAYENLAETIKGIASSHRLQTVHETSRYRDTKYTGGAVHGLKLNTARAWSGMPPFIAANVAIPMLSTGKTVLAMMPDRALVFQGKSVGAVEYKDLDIQAYSTQFIEHSSVPSDATVVGQTWQYVNKWLFQ
jgi:hypothetical protein